MTAPMADVATIVLLLGRLSEKRSLLNEQPHRRFERRAAKNPSVLVADCPTGVMLVM